MQRRRFTRLTNAFSKKLTNLKAACALHFAHYNFCRVHQSLRVTPAMTAAFYSLLFGLSWGDVNLIAPASASLTFVTNAIAAKIFLHERVDHRRWMAAVLVAGGVVLLAA
jgi:hypothetical protein